LCFFFKPIGLSTTFYLYYKLLLLNLLLVLQVVHLSKPLLVLQVFPSCTSVQVFR